MAGTKTPEAVKQITYLAGALKAPRITAAAARLADQARDAGWSFEDYLAAVLEREVSARNVVLLRPPGTGKIHMATALGIVSARRGHRVLFAGATEWVTRLTDAHRQGRLPQELDRLRRCGLIIVDEVGYLPFEQDAANLFFQLVSSRYEHASLILTSNLPFSGWGGVFGDQAVAAAMIGRIVHHADVLTLKGASYRLEDEASTAFPASRRKIRQTKQTTNQWPRFPPSQRPQIGASSTSPMS